MNPMPGIYSGMTYPEWLEWKKAQKAATKKDRFEKITEFFSSCIEGAKGSVIFHSRKIRERSEKKAYATPFRIAEVVEAIAAFVLLIWGLNILALIA